MKIITKLKQSAFFKSVASLSIGQILALVINIISTPILSRIYSREAFGELAWILSTATLVISIVGLGLGSAIMVPTDDKESEDIIVSLFGVQFIIVTILFVILFSISPFYQIFNINIPYLVAISLMYVYILLNSLSTLLIVYLNKKKMNSVLLLNPLIGAISLLIIKIPLGLINLDYYGLFIATIASFLIINVHMLIAQNPFKNKFSFSKTISIFKKYRKFLIYQYPSNLLNQFGSQFPKQYISASFGNIELADLDMSDKIVNQPLGLIASPIQAVYFRTISEKYKRGEDIGEFTYKLVIASLILGIIPVLLLLFMGDSIFAFVLGSEWSFAGRIAGILSVSYTFNFIYSCITYARVVINQQKSNLVTTIINIILTVVFLVTTYNIYGTLISLIYAIGIVTTIYNIMNISITLKLLGKKISKFLFYSTLYCLVAIIVLYYNYLG